MLQFRAILFDLDGVIIYSEDLHARAKQLTLEKYGIKYPDSLFNDFKGRPDKVFWNHVSEELTHGAFPSDELDSCKRKIFLDISDSLSIVPGALEFIIRARDKFPHMALVTSAIEADLMISERKFRFLKWFDVVQLGEHTVNHKPHPEPYLNALSRLGVNASQSLVIEDSPNGVISARAAGCKVIGITTGFSPSELNEAGAEHIITGFNEIDLLINRVHPDE